MRPDDLTGPEAAFWDAVIAPAAHLEETDTMLCTAAVRVWGLYSEALTAAEANPTDPAAKNAVLAYGAHIERLAKLLQADPLAHDALPNLATPQEPTATPQAMAATGTCSSLPVGATSILPANRQQYSSEIAQNAAGNCGPKPGISAAMIENGDEPNVLAYMTLSDKRRESAGQFKADGRGFEPPVPARVQRFSRPPP